jgi:hypothetical protein
VDLLALLMNLSLDGLTKTTKTTKEELIAQRISKRAAKKSEIREKAESYKIAVIILSKIAVGSTA